MTLQTQRVQSLEQVCAFLEGNEAVDFVEGDREGVYDLVRRTLVKLRYHRLGKPGKGLVKRYLGKVTGLSRAQHTRPSAVRIGVRRRPTPRGRPGYLRVDTVQAISEAFLIPVLESLIGAFPFEVNAFNRDWLSPFLNYHRLTPLAGLSPTNTTGPITGLHTMKKKPWTRACIETVRAPG